jgi:hypothetical protein
MPKEGDTTNCNNWWGITLLSVPSKTPSRIILYHIKDAMGAHFKKIK